MKLITTFKNANVTFQILARSSRKQGISVMGRQKIGTAKYVIGLRQVFKMDDEDGAKARYEKMVAEAEAAGWKKVSASTGRVGAFITMPLPPTEDVPQTEPPAAKIGAKGEAAPKKGGGKGK